MATLQEIAAAAAQAKQHEHGQAATPEPAASVTAAATTALATTTATGTGKPSAALAIFDDDGITEDALAILEDEGFGGGIALMDINGADAALGSALPQLKLAQLMGEKPEGVEPGQFYHAITNESYASLGASLMAQKFGRQLLGPYDGEGLKVICSASEGQHRDNEESCDEDQAPPFGTPCERCPLSKWDGKKPPACSEVFVALLRVKETEEAAVAFFRRTAIGPWRKATQQIKLYGMRAAGQLGPAARRLPVNILAEFRMTSEKVSKGGKTWYEPRFSAFTMLTDLPTIAERVSELAQVVPMFVKARAEELGDGGAEVEPWDEEKGAAVDTTAVPADTKPAADAGFKL